MYLNEMPAIIIFVTNITIILNGRITCTKKKKETTSEIINDKHLQSK